MGYTPVTQRNNQRGVAPSGYVPVAERKEAEPFSPIDFNLPDPFSMRTSNSTAQTIEPGTADIMGTIGNFTKEVGQGIARNIASAGVTVAGQINRPEQDELFSDSLKVEDIQSFFGQALFETVFGKDTKEIQSVEQRIFEAEPKLKKWQSELAKVSQTEGLTAVEKFVTTTLANMDAPTLAFTGIMGSVGLDMSPFGGLQKNVFKKMIDIKNEGDAIITLSKMGVQDDIARTFAKDIVNVSNEKDAKKIFDNIVKLQSTTKPSYTPMAQRVIPKTDINGNQVEELFARKATALEQKSPTAKSRGYNSVPEKEGYDKVFKPYGENGAGYYYSKVIDETPVVPVVDDITDPSSFKTAEEYVKAQGEPVYQHRMLRDTADSDLASIKKDGFDSIHIEAFNKPLKPFESKFSKQPNVNSTNLERGNYLATKKGETVLLPPKEQIVDGGNGPFIKPGWKPNENEIIKIRYDGQTAKEALSEKLTAEWNKGQVPIKTVKLPFEKPPTKITRTAKEQTLLKEKIKQQAKGARAGSKEGQKIGKAGAENVAETRQAKAVRTEQLKALKGGIKLSEAKNKIINTLKTATSVSQSTKNDVVAIVKEFLSPEDRGKALTLVRDAKTPRDLTKAAGRVFRWADDAEKKAIRNDIVKTQKRIMDSSSISIDYKARVKELMGDFELKGHREDTLKRLKATQEYIQDEISKGNDVEIPRRILKSLELLNRTPFEQITTSQLVGLKAEMELLEELGRTKLRTSKHIWEIQKAKILDEVKMQGAEPIERHTLLRPEIGERLTITQKFQNFIWRASDQAGRIDRAISPMDTIFDLLDGGRGLYNGANFRFFKGQVDAGYGRYITRRDSIQSPVVELIQKYNLEDTNLERMGVVAAREQDGGMEKLVSTGFTKDAVNAVSLSKEEREVLDLMRSTFDSQFPEVKDVMRRVYNKPVEKVKNYFSFMTDWKAIDENEVFERFGSKVQAQIDTPRHNVEAGFVEKRVGGDQKININALDVFLRHTDNTSYLLEMGETTKMLGEVSKSPEYADMVGDAGALMVNEWIDVVARKGGAKGAQEIAVLDTIRRNVGAGILGLKLSTIAIQPTALIDGMGFIGVKYGMKGVTNFTTSTEWRKFIAKMPEISDRMGGEFALRELTDKNWLVEVQRKGFIPLQKLDQMTAGAVAGGAYEKKMIEMGLEIDLTKGYNPEALAYAQLAVRRTQSSGSFKDVPLAISRGALTGNRSLDKAIFQFQNFLLTRWSRIRHDAIRAGINEKDPKKAIPIFTAIIFSAMAASGTRLGVNKLQDLITGREDEDTVSEDLTKSFMYEMTGNVPFVGTTVSMAMYGGEMFPILDAPKGVVEGLTRAITSKTESAKLRGVAEFMGSTGALVGIPGSAQAKQLAMGALQDEQASPKGKKSGSIPGLPDLPSLKKSLPQVPGLPKLP